jgi:hypothetical protein
MDWMIEVELDDLTVSLPRIDLSHKNSTWRWDLEDLSNRD